MAASRQSKQRKRAPRRGPGRPSAGDASGEALREHIIVAAERVYAEHGYHGSSVQLLLHAAGVSRPTFYRYFRDRYEVLELLIARLNDELLQRIGNAFREPQGDPLEALVDAYFAWGEAIGPLAGPLYREIHDDASPASAQRRRIVREMVALLSNTTGAETVDPLLFEAAIGLVEQLGHAVFWPQALADSERERRRSVILVALRGMLGLADD